MYESQWFFDMILHIQDSKFDDFTKILLCLSKYIRKSKNRYKRNGIIRFYDFYIGREVSKHSWPTMTALIVYQPTDNSNLKEKFYISKEYLEQLYKGEVNTYKGYRNMLTQLYKNKQIILSLKNKDKNYEQNENYIKSLRVYKTQKLKITKFMISNELLKEVERWLQLKPSPYLPRKSDIVKIDGEVRQKYNISTC